MVAQNPKGEAAAAGIGRKRGRGEKEKMDKKEKGEKKGRDRKREVDRTERWESKERGTVKMGLRIVFAHTPKYKRTYVVVHTSKVKNPLHEIGQHLGPTGSVHMGSGRKHKSVN